MSKTLEQAAKEMLEEMNEEEIRKAAEFGLMIAMKMLNHAIGKMKKELDHGKEK